MQVGEENPPAGVEPVEGMLLSSLPVTDPAQARRVIGYYRQRWQVEEGHRCPKQGCRPEPAQLKTVAALANLAALLSVVAVGLPQLRDRARDPAPAGSRCGAAGATSTFSPKAPRSSPLKKCVAG